MRAGRLSERITLLRPQAHADASTGETLIDFADAGTVWAERRDVRGGETFAGQARLAEAEVEFRIRWTPGLDPTRSAGIDPTWRVRHGARLYEVLAVLELGRRDTLQLVCSTRAEVESETHED